MRNDYVITFKDNSTSFMHHGILGQKWGVRRFQNYDGTLTNVGKIRYNTKAMGMSNSSTFVKEPIKSNWKKVNPGFANREPGTQTNCGNCAMAHELNERGYNTTAIPNLSGMSVGELISGFKDANDNTFSSIDLSNKYQNLDSNSKISLDYIFDRGKNIANDVSNYISNQYPNNSRGFIKVDGYGITHWMNWKKNNGHIIYEDDQSDKDLINVFSRYDPYLKDGLLIGRVDNLTIDDEIASKMVNGYKDSKNEKYTNAKVKGKNYIMTYN